MKLKKSIVFITVVLVSLLFVFASESGPQLVNINPLDLSAKQTYVLPGSDVKTVRPDIEFGKIPLYFIANKGQVNAKVRFYAKASRYTLWMTKEGLMFDSFRQVEAGTTHTAPSGHPSQEGSNRFPHSPHPVKMERDVSRLMFVGANKNPQISAVQPAKLKVNYFIGNDKSKWNCDMPTSMAVLYKSLYKNVNLKVYGIEKQIEYDWIVKPGGDPGDISFQYQNVKGTRIDEEGNLLIETEFGELMHKKPVSYQLADGKREILDSRFKKIAENTYGFEVGSYDRSRELIIDPVVLAYSSYMGGDGYAIGLGIAVDGDGFVYVAGYTNALHFTFGGGYQEEPPGVCDGYIIKLDPQKSGMNSVLYLTYLGGEYIDHITAIAVDDHGNAYVTGDTASWDFPVKNPYQDSQFDYGAFVTRLDTNESGINSLKYSTFLGGNGRKDIGYGIAVDDDGNAYVGGRTDSTDFPTKNPYQEYIGGGGQDVFVARLDTNVETPEQGLNSLKYSTYLGGVGWDYANAIAVDGDGFAYVTGMTWADFPTTPNRLQPNQPTIDAFVAKLDTNVETPEQGLNSLKYSTYLGGDSYEYGHGIAVDDDGFAYVTGYTRSTDFPTSDYPYMSGPVANAEHVFVTKLDTNEFSDHRLPYSTYMPPGQFYGIAVDDDGYIYAAGHSGPNFPLREEFQEYKGDWEAFAVKLNPFLPGDSGLIVSTCLGGTGLDHCMAMAIDDDNGVYVTGSTKSTDMPVFKGFQPYYKLYDGFVARLKFPKSNQAPVADAGGDISCVQGDTKQLNGSASYDPDGDALTYSWQITSKPTGSNAQLSYPNQVDPALVTDLPGDYIVSLVVNDGQVNSDPDTVTVTAISFEEALNENLTETTSIIVNIPDSSFKMDNNGGTPQKTNLIKFVDQAMNLIAAGDYNGAKDKLENTVLKRIDGCANSGGVSPDKNDWILTCQDQSTVYLLVQEALTLIAQIML
jgi:hypothetical protein